MAKIQFTSRIVPTTSDGVLVEATNIKDEGLGKLQSEINSDLYERVELLGGGGAGENNGLSEIKEKLEDISGRLEVLEEGGTPGDGNLLQEAKLYTDNKLSERLSWEEIR